MNPLTTMLKEQYTKNLSHLHMAKTNMLTGMFKVTDKLMAHLSQTCVCCQARGFNDCPLASTSADSGPDHMPTPANPKLSGLRLDLSDCEDSTNRASSSSSKRPPLAPDSVMSSKRNKAIMIAGDAAHRIKEYSLDIYMKTEASYSSDETLSNSPAVFGQLTYDLPKRWSIFSGSYASNPWKSGRIPPQPQIAVAQELEMFFKRAAKDELERYWLLHDTPRLVCVSEMAVLQQLAGDKMLEHELSCVIFRRFSQTDLESNEDCPYLSWRHIMVQILRHQYYPAKTTSIHSPFKSVLGRPHQILCQFFFVPATLDGGWVLYMVFGDIHVLDPLAGAKGPAPERKECHDLVSSRLHDALFKCFAEFFAGWPTRSESGLCVLHLLLFFDGERLKSPITKNNLDKTMLAILHEIVKLWDNRSPLPSEALWNVLAPSQFSLGDFTTNVDT